MGRQRRGAWWRRTAAAACLLVALPACGLGDRAALEDVITSAPQRMDGAPVAGTVTVESRVLSIPDPGALGGLGGFGAPALPGTEPAAFEIPEGGLAFGSTTMQFEMDLATSRVSLRAEAGQEPIVYADDLVYFGRRAGVPADDARPWVRVDLAEIDDGAGEIDPLAEDATAAVVAAHLAVITDLAAGTLTGSIETRERSEVNGTDVTRYEVNIALDKALSGTRRSRYPEDRRETVEELLDLLGIDGNEHRAELWLDDEGNLRRLSIALRQRPLPKVVFAMVVTVDFVATAGTYTAALPTPEEVLSVDSVVRFVRTVMGAPEEDDVPEDAVPEDAVPEGTVPEGTGSEATIEAVPAP